ncbi:4-hydroxy-tetrahydrodipicolinate reductase [Syntrophorhabdus aromaticivorans]|uniref:4-hydroxy-tetrahydrodipicolinate reductase n=1 Tax=Syntrophorhabdus aromaticivorans TaxID=328301 RepID=A0A351U0A1_9BACT|nr:4-hydroxy-tetrahydrodipicolinate reductase [Syntrophorhabdus aromaticivorans]NLW34924.1 4-hydroxy-tetrahydrodipicolinate reductase [Syntrophorhabdus aromaticivorans]HBA53382.1 4-hydroxy-tetrahydrodipicolinate reductase [Syntrophorhabdus aromaticivorans]
MTNIIITGVCGRMGAAIFKLALKDPDLAVVGIVETKDHPAVGRHAESLIAGAGNSLIVEDDLAKVVDKGEVVIDFTQPRSSLEHFRLTRQGGKAIVIGTTGFTDDALKEIMNAGDARVVISPNMSVGMNLMFDVVERLAHIMKDDYDIEVVEMHHKLKKDAPSGTAMKLKDIIESSEPDRQWIEVFGRKGILGERKKEEVAVLALRGGDVVGEHTVMFAGIGERLEITHRAFSRENFAQGALVAARWLATQDPGVYSMKDVLGL